jgi:hypothetical protein
MCVLAALSGVATAQERDRPERRDQAPGREHFQLKVGAAYDEGDFGTSDTTRSFFFPVTLRYLGDRFDVGLTGSLVYLDTESRVVVVDGLPTPVDRQRRTSDAGFGDLVLRGRYYAYDDPGVDAPLPGVTPFIKVKIPTADESKGLGTGEWDVGFGLELDKRLREFFLLGDLSYTVIGDPPGQNFRNRPAASIGIGRFFTPDVAVTALLDWRRAIVAGRDDALELVGLVQVRLSPTLLVTPNAFVGLTDGSPDFGLGVEVSWRFGRY